MSGRVEVTNTELCQVTRKSNGTISKRLNKLIDMDIIKMKGNKYDSSHTYYLE